MTGFSIDGVSVDINDIPDMNLTSSVPMSELGSSGLRRWGGYVDEEFLPQLRGRKAIGVYREMSENDPIIGALLWAIDKLLRQVIWRVDAASSSPDDQRAALFVEQCIDDMCYDDQTEVLTRRGWVRFAELTDSDEVAQRTSSGELEYVLPRQRHIYDYTGDLLGSSGDAVDFLVSPNHRMLFAPRTGRKHDIGQKTNLGIYKARDIYGKSGWLSKEVRWTGESCGLSKDYLEFLGFCLADGSVSSKRQVVLIQKETGYVEDLLMRCGLSESVHRRMVNGSTQWVIYSTELAKAMVTDFGDTSRNKHLPQWLIQATPDEQESFLRGFAEGDGYTAPTGLIALSTASKQLADDLQIIAMKVGYAATVLNRTGSQKSFNPGSDQYQVSLWSQARHLQPYLKSGRSWHTQPYDGKIYCVSVPSGVIMVRRNGKAIWSGNSHTWDDMVSEILSMLVYGWSWHEVVYKRRVGNVRNPSMRSRHNDGMIGWRKIPIRAQETLLRWEFDADGGIQSMVQLAPPDYKTTVIPIRKSLLFRTAIHKNNPEGKSVLRNCYRPYYFKKRIEENEGIGIERDLAGMPIATVPAELFNATPGSKEAKTLEAFKRMVRSVRRDEQEGIVMPQAFYEGPTGTPQPMYKFELLASGGGRAFNTDQTIQRYEQRILMTVLADFILVGHEDTGSYALHTDKSGIFRSSLNSFATAIANVFNRHEIPRLFSLNGWNLEQLPRIMPSDVDAPDLTELGSFISNMTNAGMTFFPDPDLEEFIRRSAKLPEKSPETIQMQAQMQAQSAAMQSAQDAMEQAQSAPMSLPDDAQLADRDSSQDPSQDPFGGM